MEMSLLFPSVTPATLALTVAVAVVLVILYYVYCWYVDDLRPKSMAGKRVLITGAASGVGKKTAYRYAELRAALIIVDCRGEPLAKVAAKCRRLGAAEVCEVVADLTVADDRTRLVHEVHGDGDGEGRLDCLIMGHALMDARLWMGSGDDLAVLHRLMDVNFFSYVHLVSALMDTLTKSRGSICVVSAVNGCYSSIFAHSYGATKAALNGFFTALRQELTYRGVAVSVTIVVLGYTATEASMAVMRDALPDYNMPSPADVNGAARVIVRGVSRRSALVYYPLSARLICYMYRVLPALVEHVTSTMLLTAAAPAHAHPWTLPCTADCGHGRKL